MQKLLGQIRLKIAHFSKTWFFLKKYSFVYWIYLLSSFLTCKIPKQFLEQLQRYWDVTLLGPKMGPCPTFPKQEFFQKKVTLGLPIFLFHCTKFKKQKYLQTIGGIPDIKAWHLWQPGWNWTQNGLFFNELKLFMERVIIYFGPNYCSSSLHEI